MNTNGVMALLILVWSFFLLYQPLEDERDEHDPETGRAVGKGSQLDANKKAMSIQVRRSVLFLSAFKAVHRCSISPMKLQLEIENAIHKSGQSAVALMDLKMKNKLTDKTSEVNKELLIKGLLKPFPQNCISLMTTSGAKGSMVNFQQISSCLGQQELEGKRVPRMVSGKTLPCFPSWDYSARAGGFIADRFLTSLRPQEYYFHCMAGREGSRRLAKVGQAKIPIKSCSFWRTCWCHRCSMSR